MSNSTIKREQSPRWLSHLKKVLESAENDIANHALTNDETYKRGLSWLEVLMSGKPLSPKQAANFLDSIRKRVRGKAEFGWSGTIQLTAKQIRDEEQINHSMERFTKAARTKSTAIQMLMDVLKAKLDDLDWTDVDMLGALQAHIAAFDPATVEAVEEEAEEVDAPAEPAVPNAFLDGLMKQFPTRERFPSNRWSDEHMEVVHSGYRPFSNESH